jgi:hypothetical protein
MIQASFDVVQKFSTASAYVLCFNLIPKFETRIKSILMECEQHAVWKLVDPKDRSQVNKQVVFQHACNNYNQALKMHWKVEDGDHTSCGTTYRSRGAELNGGAGF